MNNSLMVMTGTLRAFDGYDRWEKFPYRTFGSKEELEVLKEELENPLFSNKQYIHLEIRQATEQEKVLYLTQLQEQLLQHEKAYAEVLKQKQQLSTRIQEDKTKIRALEELKIPH